MALVPLVLYVCLGHACDHAWRSPFVLDVCTSAHDRDHHRRPPHSVPPVALSLPLSLNLSLSLSLRVGVDIASTDGEQPGLVFIVEDWTTDDRRHDRQ